MVSVDVAEHGVAKRGCQPIGLTERGFTLMEVLVALSIVAIALTAVYRMHSQTLFIDERSRSDTIFTLLARQKLADLEILNLSEFNGDSGTFDDVQPGYAWEIRTENIASDQFQDDGPILKRFEIIIRHSDDGARFTLNTYRLVYE